MYKITIRTKSGGAAPYEASEEVFQSFKRWLVWGEGTAENDPRVFAQFPGQAMSGYHQKPWDIFFFQEGAIRRDNIDLVSWKRASSTENQVHQGFEILDEAPDTLYLLMRDRLPTGTVREIIKTGIFPSGGHRRVYTNGHLAAMAAEYAADIRRGRPADPAVLAEMAKQTEWG